MKQISSKATRRWVVRTGINATALLSLVIISVVVLTAVLPVAADSKVKSRARLTEEQRIIHLLNRIGFGPRPGDVERVKKLGLNKYIELQLHPDRIDESGLQSRLEGLESLRMTASDLYDKYPAPQQLARQLGLQLGAPQPGTPGNAAGANNSQMGNEGESVRNQQERRRRIQAEYAARGLKPPQALIQELQAQKIIRAVYSERQLQEVMTDFWFNHFNIFWGKGADRWLTTEYEMKAIRPNTLGKFHDLLLATAKSPAMLFYLDNFQSSSPNAVPPRRRPGQADRLQRRQRQAVKLGDPRMQQRRKIQIRQRGQFNESQQMRPDRQQQQPNRAQQLARRRPGINENYAREIMELHTLGVDGGYSQKDVQEVARCFTGWTILNPRTDGSFIFRPFMHDEGEKAVLGHKIPAGGGIKDGERVIEILARHPNTAKFLSTKLCRRFVSDNPPQALVDRVANVYLKSDGDIREMLRAILTSSEFYSPEAYRAKIKSPFELAVSAVRALSGQTDGSRPIAQFIGKMGQPLYAYQAPTGYPDRAEQWVNTGALLERLNFGLALGSNRVRGTTIEPGTITEGTLFKERNHLMDRAIKVLLNGDVSAQTRGILEKQLKDGVPVKGELGDLSATSIQQADGVETGDTMAAEAVRGGRALRRDQRATDQVWGRRGDRQASASRVDSELAKVIGLVLGSPEFQRR